MSVFCDWLTVTSPPGGVLHSAINPLLDSLSLERHIDGSTSIYKSEAGGVLHVIEGKRWDRISASGQFLAHLRTHALWHEYLSALAEVPATSVTRLDAALDVDTDAAPVIRRMHRKYKDGYAFTRKSVSRTSMLQTRLDGQTTGSVYLGSRDSTVSLRAYDKQHEAYEKRGEILPPRLRYELTANREVGCTLRDAQSPEALFYHFMSPEFLKRPQGVPDWVPYAEGWAMAPSVPRLPAERLLELVDGSVDLRRMVELARECGPEGETFLLGLLRKRVFGKGAEITH